MNKIIIRGAREHNLKNINLEIPHNKLIVITGVSGSGKSSLAFDTIYAEGQRRYVESLSAYARQFLGQMEKPDIDHIEGLSPAISIEQKSVSKNPRSTVGTITEIYDYLRLLFARIGEQHCYRCGKRITKQSTQEVIDSLIEKPEGTKLTILSPLVSGKKGEHHQLIEFAKKEGFVRVRIDGKIQDLSEKLSLDKNKKHSIEVVVDRIVMKDGVRPRLSDSVETAMALSKGKLIAICDKEESLFSSESCCPDCGISYDELLPRDFSFNSPYGACKSCDGLGSKLEIDPDLIVPNKDLSIWQGAIKPIGAPFGRRGQELEALAAHYGFKLSTTFSKLKPEIQRLILHGSEEKLRFDYKGFNSHYSYSAYYEGVIPNLQRRYRQTKSEYIRGEVERYMSNIPCSVCSGKRLKQESLFVLINGSSIADISALSVDAGIKFFENLKLTATAEIIASQIIKEIKARLSFLGNVGVAYLTLDRTAVTLSGGEGQRIRLATQIGSGLVGVLYVLDEPSIGLHQRDNHKLISTLKGLQELGNTVIVVEHDEQMMREADWVIDLGPGAGKDGGYLVAEGTPSEIEKNEASLTGKYLSKALEIAIPQERKHSKAFLRIKGASHNNLKGIDVKIPMGTFTCVTGVSGSGKSSLISETLHPALAGILHHASIKPGHYKAIEGIEYIDKVINITQAPIGRTPRSNPATYTGLFTPIRELFSELPESRVRGYRPGRFSFNVRGGRCEACEGDGEKKIEMFFLPDVYIPCEVCKGRRYNYETLQVKYKGKNIADILDMTASEALPFFARLPIIKNKLQVLCDVGLGYIRLGQPAPTLSGGEAQRIKLSGELSKKQTGATLYLLDEPTTGLHFADIQKLLDVLFRLRDMGNTILVIEHNLDVIKTADYIIDLGPEGGDDGGRIVAEGTPEDLARMGSYTGEFLRKVLSKCKMQNVKCKIEDGIYKTV